MNIHPHEFKPVIEVPAPVGAAVDCTDPDGAFHQLLAIAASGTDMGLALTLGDVHWNARFLEDFGGDTCPVIRVEFDSRDLAGGVPTGGVRWHRVLTGRGDGLVLFRTTCCDGAPTLIVDSSFVLADYLDGKGDVPAFTVR